MKRPATVMVITALAAFLSIPAFAAPAETEQQRQPLQDQGSTPCNCCVQCRAAHKNGAREQPMAEPCRECCSRCGMKTPLDDELPAELPPEEKPRPLR